MHPPATPDHKDARAFIRALRLSTTPAHLTPARSSLSLHAPSASPYFHTGDSRSSTPSHASSSAMTEDEERAMEAELEHELTQMAQQEEAEDEEGPERMGDEQSSHTATKLDTPHEHKDNHHDASHLTPSDMLFPPLLTTPSPSTPTRHFHRNSPGAFLSPPVRQLPSPSQLHSLLLMTQGRLREREQQVQMAAEVGEALLRQQEERDEEVRQWKERAEEAEAEVERVRDDMTRMQERNIALLTQVREAEATANERQRRTAEAEEQAALLSTQLARERERRRGEERQQLSTSSTLVTDNANLTSSVATLNTQLASNQQRIVLLTQQHEAERASTLHYRQEAEAWERLADERDRKAKEREDELLEEIDSLSYRCRQLQEAVPMCGPSTSSSGGDSVGSVDYESDVVAEGGESREVKEVREAGRNKRLSMMPYESLLAELEGELQAEIAARQPTAALDEADKENVSREANAGKAEQVESKTYESLSDAKLRSTAETAEVSPTPIAAADAAETALSSPSPAAVADTAASSPAPPARPPSPSASGVDVLREYFHLATLSVKLSSVETNVSACNLNVNELYQRVIREDVAFHRWHVWIEDRMREMKATSPGQRSKGATGASAVAAPRRASPRTAERECEREKVLYAHGSSVSVSLKQRPQPAANAAKKPTGTTGGGLLQSMRRGWGRG